jgi:hypothetical protein
LFATVAPEKPASQELDASVGASGPHDFAVRLKRHSSKAPSASTASRPTSVTIAKRPSVGTGPNQNIAVSTGPSSAISENQKLAAVRRKGLLHKKSSYPPTGRANARPMTGSSGVSSTPGLIDSIACVSGILDRPLSRAMTRGGMRARREFSPISFFQTATTQGASKPSLRALAKQSMEQRARLEWIASSRSLSSGAHSRDPLAPRNDGV